MHFSELWYTIIPLAHYCKGGVSDLIKIVFKAVFICVSLMLLVVCTTAGIIFSVMTDSFYGRLGTLAEEYFLLVLVCQQLLEIMQEKSNFHHKMSLLRRRPVLIFSRRVEKKKLSVEVNNKDLLAALDLLQLTATGFFPEQPTYLARLFHTKTKWRREWVHISCLVPDSRGYRWKETHLEHTTTSTIYLSITACLVMKPLIIVTVRSGKQIKKEWFCGEVASWLHFQIICQNCAWQFYWLDKMRSECRESHLHA